MVDHAEVLDADVLGDIDVVVDVDSVDAWLVFAEMVDDEYGSSETTSWKWFSVNRQSGRYGHEMRMMTNMTMLREVKCV